MSDTPLIPSADFLDSLPTGTPLAFHGTSRQTARTIYKHGFDPSHTKTSDDEIFFKTIAGDEFPLDRTNSTFFDLDPQIARKYTFTGYSILIDPTKLTNPMCVGGCQKFDKVIAHTPDDTDRLTTGPYTDKERSIVDDYLATVTHFSPGTNPHNATTGHARPELIVEGHIPPSAIIGVIDSADAF